MTPRSLSILLVAVAIGGCGAAKDSARETASTALGDITQQDKSAIQDYVLVAQEWPIMYGTLTSAEAKENVAGMRKAVDGLGDLATRAQDTVLDMDTASVQRDF